MTAFLAGTFLAGGRKKGLPVPDCARTQIPAQAQWMATSHIHQHRKQVVRPVCATLYGSQRRYVSNFPFNAGLCITGRSEEAQKEQRAVPRPQAHMPLKDRLLQSWPRRWPLRSCWEARRLGPGPGFDQVSASFWCGTANDRPLNVSRGSSQRPAGPAG